MFILHVNKKSNTATPHFRHFFGILVVKRQPLPDIFNKKNKKCEEGEGVVCGGCCFRYVYLNRVERAAK